MVKAEVPKANQGEGDQDESRIIYAEASYKFEGLVPPPEIFNAYDPETKQLMLNLAQKQLEHRMSMETSMMQAGIKDTVSDRFQKGIGQFLGFGIGIFAIAAGSYIAVTTDSTAGSVAGSVIGGGALVSLVSVFVLGKRYEREEAEDEEDEPEDE